MSLLKKLPNLVKFYSDRAAFLKAGGIITHFHPIIDDYQKVAGTANGHYFHQDLLVASLIHKANPQRHIDVGSSISGFVSHVASYRQIEVFDIRPLCIAGHAQIKFCQGNLMELNDNQQGICDSLSCLHALEHFGLGRYGDPIDPLGHRKGFENMSRLLKVNGLLYISFPIGTPAVHFNAHRIFAPHEILQWAQDRFLLSRFDYVDDQGDLHCEANLATLPKLKYGCGIYTLRKISTDCN